MNTLFSRKPYIPLLLAAFFFLFTFSKGNAQVNLSVTYPNFDHLSIGDIDFTLSSNQNLIFIVSITSPETVSVRLHATVDIELASGETYNNFMDYTTVPIFIPKLPDKKTITNLDLGRNSPFKAERNGYHINEAAKNTLQNLVLSLGKLPAGTYTFTMWLDDINHQQLTQPMVNNIVIQNITRIDLLSPPDESVTPTVYPLFQWNFDGDSVELSVYEKLPQYQSREEAINGTPHLVIHSGSALLPNGTHSLQYPVGFGRSLEEGKTYVWKVTAFTRGLNGAAGINSELWEFSTPSSNQQSSGKNSSILNQINSQTLSNQLQSLPGVNSALLNQLLQGGYQPTGVMYNNGLPITLQELQKILNQLDIDPDMVLGIEILD